MASEHDRRLAEYERQVGDLQGQLKGLEEEVGILRRRLQDAPKRVRTLEEKILETKGQLQQAVSQNERLSATVGELCSRRSGPWATCIPTSRSPRLCKPEDTKRSSPPPATTSKGSRHGASASTPCVRTGPT